MSLHAEPLDARLVDGRWRLSTRAGPDAPAHEQLLPAASPVLGPEGLRRRTVAELHAVGDRFSARVFLAELGGAFASSRELVAREEIELDGPRIAAQRVVERTEGMPGERTLWLDAAGDLLRSTEAGPFGAMEIVRAARPAALAARAGGALPEELYRRTLVRSNVRLPSPRAISRLRLRLRRRDAQLLWPDLAGPTQTVLASDAESRLIEIVRPEPPARAPAEAASHPAGPERGEAADSAAEAPARGSAAGPVATGDREELAASALVDPRDSEIQRLAHALTGQEPDPYRRAVALSTWVHQHMRFDLGIVLAPASELVRERRGTCAGYAVLLMALARAAELPARLVLGSVYLQGAWAGHAWVELEIGGRWLPFDAALGVEGPADAARLALARDTLAHGLGAGALVGLQFYGAIDIAVVDYTLAGEARPVPAGDAAYTVDAHGYRNPGLGLELGLPPGWQIEHADGIWPDATLLALAGPRRARARLTEEPREPELAELDLARAHLAAHGLAGAHIRRRELGGWPAFYALSGNLAGVVWLDGTSVFVLRVEGSVVRRELRALGDALAWQRRPLPAPVAPRRL